MDEDDEPEVELTGDAGAPLNVTRVPVIVSVSQVGVALLGTLLNTASHLQGVNSMHVARRSRGQCAYAESHSLVGAICVQTVLMFVVWCRLASSL
jgi:hypothetical protein